jgi:restriction endonuclease S subunit
MNSQRYIEDAGITVDIYKESRITLQSDLGDRFDCNYRTPEYFKTIKELVESCIINGWELKRIGEIESIKTKEGSTPKGNENFTTFPEIPFIKTKNVHKGYLKTQNLNFLTEEAHKKKAMNTVKNGDILITIIGANFDVIGRVCVFNNKDLGEIKSKEANINQNIIRIFDIPDSYDKMFIENFLNSYSGQVQFRRFSKQTVQVNLSSAEVKLLQIPKPPKPLQEKISSIVLHGREVSDKIINGCDFKIKNVNDNLLKVCEVTVPDNNIRSFNSEISDQFNVNFYHPNYVEFLKSLRKQEEDGKIVLKKLIDLSSHIERKRNSNDDIMYKYIELGDIDIRAGNITSHDDILGKDLPSRAKWKIKENDILIPTLKGSSKNIAIVDKEFDTAVASSGFVLFSSENEDIRYYLFAVLRSPIVQMQYEKLSTGSIMPDVSSDVIKEFLIPIPSDSNIFKRTTSLIKESMNYVKKFYTEADTIIQKTESIFNDIILGRITIEEGENRSNSLLNQYKIKEET